MKYWIATCTSCGSVKITQKAKPRSCKEQIRLGERSIRRCGNELVDVQDVSAKVEAANGAKAVTTSDPLVDFAQSRVVDLVRLHQAIIAIGQAPDSAALLSREDDLDKLLRELFPTMISRDERALFREFGCSMALTRQQALGDADAR